MTGGYIFTLCVCPHLGGGGGYLLRSGWGGGVPTLAGVGGVPTFPGLGGGVPTFPGLDGGGTYLGRYPP